MAVYTEVEDDALRLFIASYDIGELLSFKGIAEGVENSNFLVHTTTGNYILTLYEKRVEPRDLPFFLGLMDHLAGRGYSCPTPVLQRDGSMLSELAGRPAAIITFLEGMWVKRPGVAHCAAVGKALAELHLAADGFDIRRPNALTVSSWRPLFEAAGANVDSVQAGLNAEILTELDAIETHWPTDLPTGVIHADMFPDNVFFLGEQLSGVIDFYFACNDFLAYDLMTCVNAWCFEFNNEFNVTKARAMLRSYHAVRPLEAGEIAALPLLAQGSSLRFFLTRLYDWLHTPDGAMVTKKDPLEYLKKVRFHRDIAGAAAYGVSNEEW